MAYTFQSVLDQVKDNNGGQSNIFDQGQQGSDQQNQSQGTGVSGTGNVGSISAGTYCWQRS